MERRLFLERLGALLGIGLAPRVAQAAPPQRIELQRSSVAGFQYHQGETVWPLLAVGAARDLAREPDNQYDARAVRVDWQGQKLGYVSRMDNATVSHLLDQGQSVTAEIVGLRQSYNPWDWIEFAVFVRG